MDSCTAEGQPFRALEVERRTQGRDVVPVGGRHLLRREAAKLVGAAGELPRLVATEPRARDGQRRHGRGLTARPGDIRKGHTFAGGVR